MRRRKAYSCGGPMSFEGSCGAPDCACCHPEWQGEVWVDPSEDTDPGDLTDDNEEIDP